MLCQSNLLALPQKGCFLCSKVTKKTQYYSFKHHHAVDLCLPKENNSVRTELADDLRALPTLKVEKKLKYFLEYKFPIEQQLSQSKIIWITRKIYSKNRKNYCKEKQLR